MAVQQHPTLQGFQQDPPDRLWISEEIAELPHVVKLMVCKVSRV